MKTAYTPTAVKAVAATAGPFGGSAVEPTMLWWLVWKSAPMTERMTTAKMERTRQLHAFIKLTMGFMVVVGGHGAVLLGLCYGVEGCVTRRCRASYSRLCACYGCSTSSVQVSRLMAGRLEAWEIGWVL